MEQVPHFKRNKIFIGIEGARLREEQDQVRLHRRREPDAHRLPAERERLK
jgi:hypothetical protein